MKLIEALRKIYPHGRIYPYGIPSSCQDEYDREYLIHWIMWRDDEEDIYILMESIESDLLPTKYKKVILPSEEWLNEKDDYAVEVNGKLFY